MTQAKAEKALKKAGLNVGNVASAYSDTVAAGKSYHRLRQPEVR